MDVVTQHISRDPDIPKQISPLIKYFHLPFPLHVVQLLLRSIFALLGDLGVVDGRLQTSGNLVGIFGNVLVFIAVKGFVHGVEDFLGVSFGSFRSICKSSAFHQPSEERLDDALGLERLALWPEAALEMSSAVLLMLSMLDIMGF